MAKTVKPILIFSRDDITTKKILPRTFFKKDSVTVAKELIGTALSFNGYTGIITEAEAYGGNDDPASHAYKKQTPRNTPMFADGGTAYVYFTYGMHHCFNIVTGEKGTASAVLIRGIQLCKEDGGIYLNGPAKLCKHMGIDRSHSGLNIFAPQSPFKFYRTDIKLSIDTTPRIGIKNGADKLWRFVGTTITTKPQQKLGSH